MSMASAIVPEKLRRDNYDFWSACMKNYLLAHDLWDLIESPTGSEPPNKEAEYKVWRKKNATALHAILISCSPYMFSKAELTTDSAKIAWDNLANSSRKPLPVPKVNAGMDNWPSYSRKPLPVPKVNAGNIPSSDTGAEFDTGDGAGKVQDDYTRFADLADSVYRGCWHSTRNFLDRHPGVINAKIDSSGRTVLHLATIGGNVETGGKLVELMSKEALAIQDSFGRTVLHLATIAGNVEIGGKLVELMSKEALVIQDSFGRTALHLATIAGNVEIGGKLVELMSKEALAIQDSDGKTALHYAASQGITKMARYIVEKNDTVVTIENKRQFIPIADACASGHRDTTIYLLSVTPLELLSVENGSQAGSLVLLFAIAAEMFDIALEVYRRCPSFACSMEAADYKTALRVLLHASRDLFPSGSQLGLWHRWIYSCIQVRVPLNIEKGGYTLILDQNQKDLKIVMQQVLGRWSRPFINFLEFSGIIKIYELKMNHAYSSRLLHCLFEHISTLDDSISSQTLRQEIMFHLSKTTPLFLKEISLSVQE